MLVLASHSLHAQYASPEGTVLRHKCAQIPHWILSPSENEAGESDREPQEARQTTLLLQQVGGI